MSLKKSLSDKTFLTNTTLPSSTKASKEFKTQQVYRIEEALPSQSLAVEFEPLPENVSIKRVVDNISKGQRNKHLWLKYFTSTENIAIISDLFWLSICRLVRQNEFTSFEEVLLARVSRHYLNLFTGIDKNYRDEFYKSYCDNIAQAVFFSVFFAFPKSRSLVLTEDFLRDFIDLVSGELTGFPVCNNAYEHWVFDLGAGNIMEKVVKSQSKPLWKSASGKLRIRYTPVMERYLCSHKYQSCNQIKNWNLRVSKRDLAAEKQTHQRMKSYRKQANDNARNTLTKFKHFEKYNKTIDKKLLENKKYSLRISKFMKNRSKEILTHNPHEYSNYLASLKDL